MSVQKETLERRLTSDDRRRIFQALGFQINGQQPNDEGWITDVLGPSELGEGKRGNFSVHAESGYAMNFGSPEWKGSLYDAVMDVCGCTFPEALEWIAQEIGYASRNGKPKRPTTKEKPKPVATLEKVERWHERLMGDTAEAKSARDYLTDARGIDPDLLRTQRVGLAHDRKKRGGTWCTWWIVFPAGIEGDVVTSLKAFAYDPEMGDWMRDGDGRKICRNAGPTSLIMLVRGDTGESIVYLGGEVDAFSAHSVGFDALTGTGGEKPPKDDWLEEIAALANCEFIVCFDGDEAGRKAAPKAARKLKGAGIAVRIAELPDGKDVNDLVVEGGREALKRVVDAAEPYESSEPERDGDEGRKRKSAATKTVDLACQHADFFHYKRSPYARLRADGQILRLSSNAFHEWLADLYLDTHDAALPSSSFKDALAALKGKARKKEHPVHVRTAGDLAERIVWINLGQGRIARVTPKEIEVVNATTCEVRFWEPEAARPLPAPDLSGTLGDIGGALALRGAALLIAVGWLLAALLPGGPYPVLAVYGPQGSGKSTRCRHFTQLVDPSSLLLRTQPRKEDDLIVAARSSHVLTFDNVSRVSDWFSDALCRVATGGGLAKRTLYTDADVTVVNVKRPVIINAIVDVVSRSDLADRLMMLELPRLSERRTERAVKARFERHRAKALGAILKGVQAALGSWEEVDLPELPRMADAAMWAEAGLRGLGAEPLAFYDAFTRSASNAQRSIIDSDLVGSLVVAVAERGGFEGTASKLLDRLREMAGEQKRSLPPDATRLAGELRRLEPALQRAYGVRLEYKRTASARTWTVQKKPEKPASSASSASSSQQNGEANDASDANDATPRESNSETGRDTLNGAGAQLQLLSRPWERWPLASGRYASIRAGRRVELDSGDTTEIF